MLLGDATGRHAAAASGEFFPAGAGSASSAPGVCSASAAEAGAAAPHHESAAEDTAAPGDAGGGSGAEEGELLEDGEYDPDSDLASLVLGELTEPWMDEAYVHGLFRALSVPVVACRLARDWHQESRPSLGYAVVQLCSHRDAARFVKRRGATGLPALCGHRYVLRPAKTPCSVYVGQLDSMPWACSAMLRYIFSDEAIANTHLPLDESGAPRGYGFVTFTKDEDAKRVIKTYANAQLRAGTSHSLRWASSNLVHAGALADDGRPPMFEAGEDPVTSTGGGEGGYDALRIDVSAATGGSGSPLGPLPLPPGGSMCGTPGLPSCAALMPAVSAACCSESMLPPAAAAAAAQVARAQELHAQAQAAGLHPVETRLEMAAQAQRLLETAISHLTGSGMTGQATPSTLVPLVAGGGTLAAHTHLAASGDTAAA